MSCYNEKINIQEIIMSILKRADLNFQAAAHVISETQKFIIPIPVLENGGDALLYPQGDEKEGMPVVDWEGKPAKGRGIVFYNYKDNAYQAVQGDGTGVIIINEVSKKQAASLLAKMMQLTDNSPDTMNVGQVRHLLKQAYTLGLSDMYNSEITYVESNMNPLAQYHSGVKNLGLHKRDDRDVCWAIQYTGAIEFTGPSVTPQTYKDGCIIVQVPSKEPLKVIITQESDVRAVQLDVFLRTYTNADGQFLQLSDVPIKLTPDQLKNLQKRK